MDTDTAWELWGARDPYYGVLTHPRFRTGALTPEGRSEFFASGQHHTRHVLAVLRQHLFADFAPQRVLDFGCGVGRLVVPFGQAAAEVVGVDISPSMLAEARRNCEEHSLGNVTLLPSDDALQSVEGTFDLVHSCIVLQHIEVPRGRALFERLVAKVRPGGCGAIQVTFAWDLHAPTFGQMPPPTPAPHPASPGLLALLRTAVGRSLALRRSAAVVAPIEVAVNPDPEMQMNYYNLSELMFILQRAGVQQVHTEMTDHGGALGAFLFFRVPPQSAALA